MGDCLSKNHQNTSFQNQGKTKNLKRQNYFMNNHKLEVQQKQQVHMKLTKSQYLRDQKQPSIIKQSCQNSKIQEQCKKSICKHSFCKQCIQKATQIMNFCPMCRKFNPLNKIIQQNHLPIKQPSQEDWNIERARGIVYRIQKNQEGKTQRRLYLKDQNEQQQATNVYVSPQAKIQCSPNANIMINGKKVNPNECNQQ